MLILCHASLDGQGGTPLDGETAAAAASKIPSDRSESNDASVSVGGGDRISKDCFPEFEEAEDILRVFISVETGYVRSNLRQNVA
ncbi:hypothetical protein ANAPC5_01465 [Anaplasma phagocytophilum]|nr:hypothetical protein ANAPC5_01465 [Anaplasma phagocytophilum]